MKCPEGQWGVGCNSVCLCDGPLAGCHHETGKCPVTGGGSGGSVDPFEASGISVNLVPAAATAKTADTDYVDVIDFDREAILPRVTEREYIHIGGLQGADLSRAACWWIRGIGCTGG